MWRTSDLEAEKEKVSKKLKARTNTKLFQSTSGRNKTVTYKEGLISFMALPQNINMKRTSCNATETRHYSLK